jgi:predicted nucleotidyltransferase
MQEEIVRIILKYYPDTQAIYLFGSFSTVDEWPDSDLDIGLRCHLCSPKMRISRL